jgi:predicted HTH transcriptional regulator
LPYEEFLVQRRERMARVIEAAWNRLKGDSTPVQQVNISVSDLIISGETDAVEFKSTMRVNRHTAQQDDRMQVSVLKTIAGFLNAKGGTLLIGVADDGEVLGIEADGFASEDVALLHLGNLISARLGDVFRPYVHPRFEDQEGGRVLVVRCEAGPRAAFLKDGQLQKFFVRGGNATAELQGPAITDYVRQRFG